MNLDDYKNLTRQVTAPGHAPSSEAKLGGFIAEMRERDQRARQRVLGMAAILFAVGSTFIATGRADRPGAALTGVGVVFVAAFMGLKGHLFGRVNYAAPAQEFLAAAAKRYQFWRAEDTVFAVPLLLTLGMGGGLTVWLMAGKYLTDRGVLLALIAYIAFFIGVCVFGWVVSRKDWRREHAALIEEIRRRQRELGNG
jgi:hypothetical protein